MSKFPVTQSKIDSFDIVKRFDFNRDGNTYSVVIIWNSGGNTHTLEFNRKPIGDKSYLCDFSSYYKLYDLFQEDVVKLKFVSVDGSSTNFTFFDENQKKILDISIEAKITRSEVIAGTAKSITTKTNSVGIKTKANNVTPKRLPKSSTNVSTKQRSRPVIK